MYYRENSLFVKKEITDKNKEKIKDYLELNTALKDVIYNPMSLSKDLDQFNEDRKSNKDIKESLDLSLLSVNIES